MRKLVPAGIIGCMLAGCAATPSSGVQRIGPDTYQLSLEHGELGGGRIATRRDALTQAGDYCSAQHKEIMVTGTKVWGVYDGGLDLDFRCLAAGDPELHSPNLVPEPDLTIKVR